MTDKEKIKLAASHIVSADAVLITAGAGIGVDSGLPDFRGNKGFWKAYPRISQLGVSFEEMANPAWFDKNPELAWAFYGHRYNLYKSTEPHSGFRQLLEMVKAKKIGYFVFTSNVDGQFQKAGYSDEAIAEIHGSINHFQCVNNCKPDVWQAEISQVAIDEDKFEALYPMPVCRNCGGLARPNILMFNDWLWQSQRSGLQEDKLNEFLGKIKSSDKLVVVEMGAGTALPTVRSFSENIANTYEAVLIRINVRESYIPQSLPNALAFEKKAAVGINDIYEEYKTLL